MTWIDDSESVRYAAGNGAHTENDKSLSPRRLRSRQEIEFLLRLNTDQVQLLVDTRQITPIRITGEERFDSRDIDRLIETYKATAQRRMQ